MSTLAILGQGEGKLGLVDAAATAARMGLL